jgi:hypothetical protein
VVRRGFLNNFKNWLSQSPTAHVRDNILVSVEATKNCEKKKKKTKKKNLSLKRKRNKNKEACCVLFLNSLRRYVVTLQSSRYTYLFIEMVLIF